MTVKKHVKSLQMIIHAKDMDARCKRLRSSNEYGLALLLEFIRVEACMKLYMYDSKGLEKEIKGLNLQGNYGFITNLKSEDEAQYKLLMDKGSKSARNYRNKVAHEGEKLSWQLYEELSLVTDWAFQILRREVPQF